MKKLKEIINQSLDKFSYMNLNLGSKASRDLIANSITDELNKRGVYTRWDDIERWKCDICGKPTYNVDYEYIGSGTNHLACETKKL